MRSILIFMRLYAEDYIKAIKRIQKSSGWKYQTQRYALNRLSEIAVLNRMVQNGAYIPGKSHEFVLYEQGRKRLIKALPIQDMVLQHALTDSILSPALRPYLIHDNGAGIKGKGISFTRRRFEQHLHWFYLRHRWEGYVLIIDFRKYFDNIDHGVLLDMLEKHIKDQGVMDLLRVVIDNYKVDISFNPSLVEKVFNSLDYQNIPREKLTGKVYMRKSLGIGAPVSQILGVYYPTPIDTWCKTVKNIHCYDAYMDDRIVIHHSKEYLKTLLKEIVSIANKLGIHINRKKTQIIRLSHGFTWLKTRYVLTPTGKIIKKIPRDVVTRQRRKMKHLARVGKLDVMEKQYKSWRGDKIRYNAYHSLQHLDRLYKELIRNGRNERKRTQKTNPRPGNFQFGKSTTGHRLPSD